MKITNSISIAFGWIHQRYTQRISNQILFFIREYHILPKKHLILVMAELQDRIKKRKIKKIQLNNYLFIIGRSLFGYIGTYYMYKQYKKQSTKIEKNQKNPIKNLLISYLEDEYIKITLISILITLQKKDDECLYKKYTDLEQILGNNTLIENIIHQALPTDEKHQYIGKYKEKIKIENVFLKNNKNFNIIPTESSSYIKREAVESKVSIYGSSVFKKNVGCETTLLNKNIWNKQLSYLDDLIFFKIQYLLQPISTILKIPYTSRMFLTHPWTLYKEIVEDIRWKKYLMNSQEGIYLYIIESLKKIQSYIYIKTSWREFYDKKIHLKKDNIIHNYIIKKTLSSSQWTLNPEISIRNEDHIVNTKIEEKMVELISHIYTNNMFNVKPQVTETYYILCKDIKTKMNIIIQKISLIQKEEKTAFLYIKTPKVLEELSKHLTKKKLRYQIIESNLDTKIEKTSHIILYLLPKNNNKSSTQKDLNIYVEYLHKNYVTTEGVNYILYTQNDPLYIKESDKESVNAQKTGILNNYNIQYDKNTNTDFLCRIYKESTSINRIYKNYQLTRIQWAFLFEICKIVEDLVCISKNEIYRKLFELKIKKINRYISKIHNHLRKKSSRDEWYEYIENTHIEIKNKIDNQELYKRFVLVSYARYIKDKEDSSYSTKLQIFQETILFLTRDYLCEITRQKQQIFNKKYTKDIVGAYKGQLAVLNHGFINQIKQFASQL